METPLPNYQKTFSQLSLDHFSAIEKERREFIKNCVVGGKNKGVEMEPELDDRRLFVMANQKRSQAQSLLIYNKRWYDLNVPAVKADTHDAKLLVSELMKEQHELEVQVSSDPSPPTEKAIENEHVSLPIEYLRLISNYILLGVVMVGEVIVISQALQVFGKSKMLCYLMGGAFSIGSAVVYHFGPVWLQKISSKVTRSLLTIGMLVLSSAVLVATGIFRQSYRDLMSQPNHVNMVWFLTFSLFLNFAAFLLLQVPIPRSVERMKHKRASKHRSATTPLTISKQLEEVKLKLIDARKKRDDLIKLEQELNRIAYLVEWQIYHEMYLEGLATMRFNYMEIRGAIPESFAYFEPLPLQFFFAQDIVPNNTTTNS